MSIPPRLPSTTDVTDTENGAELQVATPISNISLETGFADSSPFHIPTLEEVDEALIVVLSTNMEWDIRPGFLADAMKSLDHIQPPNFSVSSSSEMVSDVELAALLGHYSATAVEATSTTPMLPQASTSTPSVSPFVLSPSPAPVASARSSSVFSSRASTPQIQASSPDSGSMAPSRAPPTVLSTSTPVRMSRASSVAASSRASTPRTQGWSSRSGSMPPPPRALSAAPSHSHLRQQNIASEPVVAVATPLQLTRPASTSTSLSSSRSSVSTGPLRVPNPTLPLSTPQPEAPLPTIPSDSMWPQPAAESTDEDESLWGEAEAEPIAVDEEDEFPPSLYSTAESTAEGLGPRVPFSFSNQQASDYNAVPSSSSRLALATIPTPQPSPRIHANGWNPASSSSTASYPQAWGPTRSNNSNSKQRGSSSAAAGPSSTKGKGKARDTSTSMPIQSPTREDLTYADLAALNRGSAAKMSEAEMTAIAYAVGYNPKNFQRVYTYNTPNGPEKVTFPSGWTPNYALLLRTSRAPSTGPIRTESRQQIPATPYTRPEQCSLQPNLVPATAPIPFCRPSNQGLSPAETLGQTQQAATAANVMCRWEGCSIVLQIEKIWEHIKTDHSFECRMADVGLKCRWVGSDGKQCTKELMGRSMKNHVVNTHAKPTVFI